MLVGCQENENTSPAVNYSVPDNGRPSYSIEGELENFEDEVGSNPELPHQFPFEIKSASAKYEKIGGKQLRLTYYGDEKGKMKDGHPYLEVNVRAKKQPWKEGELQRGGVKTVEVNGVKAKLHPSYGPMKWEKDGLYYRIQLRGKINMDREKAYLKVAESFQEVQ